MPTKKRGNAFYPPQVRAENWSPSRSDLAQGRFGQLRVKAASGPRFSPALHGPDPKLLGRNGALVIPGM